MTKIDPRGYYNVHRCKVCADESQATPLEFAFEIMSISRPDDQAAMLQNYGAAFGDGWLVGVEGSLEYDAHRLDDYVVTDPEEPRDTSWAIKAWLVGHLAGTYAAMYAYGSPHCRDVNQHADQPEPII
jgi:hypothetical protein